MDRQIKFRGVRTDGKGWVYGTGVFILGSDYAAIPDTKDVTSEDYYMRLIKVVPKTVGQFTGLFDKHGNEIYEGDLITCLNSKAPDGVIVWCLSEKMFKIKWISKTYIQVRGQSQYYTENGEKLFANANLVWTVSGSIHEEREVSNG